MTDTTVVVSDIHLGARPDSVEQAFLDFLRAWPVDAEALLINGDLFDFWFEYRTVIPARYYPVLRALSDLRDRGVRLALVGGNHDAWGGAFLSEVIGMELLEGPVELDLGGRRALVAHGDGLGEGDRGYKVLRAVIRSRPARWLMRTVHPDLADRIARGVSRTGDPGEEHRRRGLERSRVLAEYARDLLESRPDLELVIFGHCHVPELREVEPGRFYVNSGDWIEHRTYTVIGPDRLAQHEWDDR